MKHDSKIIWPNGAGHRECTAEYADLNEALLALQPEYQAIDWDTPNAHRMNGDSAKVYNDYHMLQHRLDQMSLEGHLGRVVRY